MLLTDSRKSVSSMIRFFVNIHKHTSKGNQYARLVIAKHLDELGWKEGEEVLVEIDKGNEQIVIRKKNKKAKPLRRCW